MSAQAPSLGDVLLARLTHSADVYPQKIDLVREAALLVLLNANAYRAASFLDDRILGPLTQAAWVPTVSLAEASRLIANTRQVHFIFHTGHVGSTLVSRLLDETDAVLSLREPLPLRTLADAHDELVRPDALLSEAHFEILVAMLMRLWGRGYEGTRSCVVKATSSAGRLAVPLLAANAGARAIYMNVRPETYLATLLGGENSHIDLRGHAPGRMRRLQHCSAAALVPPLSLGELAAMSWLVESWTQREAMKRFPDRILGLDFDEFLAAVPAGMDRVLGHFGLPRDASFDRSPALARYSKAPEYAYTPEVRAEVLRDSRRHNREEISKGMKWLEARVQAEQTFSEIVKDASIEELKRS
ncbi:MAG TPA: hypothetical protein VLQ46_14635 [Casimicrobiaceae bacterium]|nr:hypothetical protein [Casimicrobiaceae bacterium]